MSLIVHLPLNGDLRNQGIGDVSIEAVTTPVFSNNGKIGKALSEGKIRIPAADVSKVFNNDAMSMAFWYNNNTSSTSGNHAICGFMGNGEGDTDAVRSWDFFNYGTPNNFHFSMGTMGTGSHTNVLPANTWVHFCITWNKGNLRIYINNELRTNWTGMKSEFTFDKSYYISFGHTPQMLNDFRIYDHCLSPMEVKRLSQGLVLHYPLNRNGWGQENLVKDSNTFAVGSGASGITPSNTTDGLHQVIAASGNNNWHSSWATSTATSILESTFSEGDKFTVSFTIKSDNANTTTPPTIYIKSGMGYYPMIGRVTSDWSTVYYSGTWKDTNGIAFHLGFGGLVGTYLFKNWKVEKGDKPTPWCPNSADTLATSMGINNGIEYDCSGYCNNGTMIGTFSWTSDTPKYGVSQVFSGSQRIEAPFNPGNSPTFTVAGWFYHASGTTYYGAKNTNNTFICLEGGRYFVYNSAGSAYVGNWTSTANTWQHIVLVHDAVATKLKLYVNGNFISEVTTNGTVYGSNILDIGGRGGGAQYSGKMSDFRIYATALSADDVKALYNNAAYIDNQSNVYAADYIETSNTALNSQGVFNTLEINEETEQVMIKDSGELYSPDFYEI